MFTGIVTDLGKIRAVEKTDMTRFEVETGYDTETIAIGASIACNGACMTVTEKGSGWFAFEASAESLNKTTMDQWTVGRPVNLERSVKLGDTLDGHLVSGHVDGTGRLRSVTPDGGSLRLVVEMPRELAKYVAIKGSVAVDGVSLTVNEVGDRDFSVNIIPHTASATNLGSLKPGDPVNLEVDLLARYIARMLEIKD